MLYLDFWCPGEVMAPPVGTNDQHKPRKTKGNASFSFLQQAYFGLRFGLRLEAQYPPASATPPPRDAVFVSDLRLDDRNSKPPMLNCSLLAAVDCFINSGGRPGYVQSRTFQGFT